MNSSNHIPTSLKLICGPMATLSHEAFRNAIEKFGGCDEYFTEMINAPSLLNMGPFEKYYLLAGPVPQKIVWQLTGTTAEPIAKAASIVAHLGGIGIDINMGCSAPQIYKTGAGIAWMLKPLSETENLIRLVKKSLEEEEKISGKHMRLSVKCRLGPEDFTDNSFNSFTDMLVLNGVELITIHPRTIKEKLRLTPRYEYVENAAKKYSKQNVKIVLNGGISDYKTASYAYSKAENIYGIMIARAAAQKPWIFSEIKKQINNFHNPDQINFQTQNIIDCQELALNFINDVQQYQPIEFHKTRLQRFFSYYCLNFSFAHYFQTQMLNSSSIDESKKLVEEYFIKEPDDRYKNY